MHSSDRFTEIFRLPQQPSRVRFELLAAGQEIQSETVDVAGGATDNAKEPEQGSHPPEGEPA